MGVVATEGVIIMVGVVAKGTSSVSGGFLSSLFGIPPGGPVASLPGRARTLSGVRSKQM